MTSTSKLSVKRIVFTGEILQTDCVGKPSMALEIRWLANLLRYSVSCACPNTPIEVVAWPLATGPDHFDGARFYALNDLAPGVDSWAKLVDSDSISPSSAEYLRPFFTDSLVIGYGMSNWMLRFLNESGIPYLDFLLHPARFLDDVFFGIRTNAPDLFAALEQFRYPEQMIELQASIHRASLLRMEPLDIAPDSGLFAAQSGIDKALVADGQFTHPEDYREAISQFVSRHHDIYIKPHPYSRDGARVVALLRSIAGDSARVHVVQDNVYRLLTQANISEVCGISSCVLYEAEYFGKSAVYMARNRMDFEAGPFDPWKFVPVYDQFLNPKFWEHVLASVCEVSAAPDLVLPPKTNRLRNNLHVFWGYGYLDYEVPLRHMGIHAASPESPRSAGDHHAEAVRLYQSGQAAEASDAFAQALMLEETSERWNDWSVAQLAAGHAPEAVDGFRLAMRLGDDPEAQRNLSVALNVLQSQRQEVAT